MDVVLMMRGISRRSDTRHTRGPGVGWVLGGGIELERLLMRNVVGFCQAGDRRNRATVTDRAAVGIRNRQIEPALKPTPGKPGGVQQIANRRSIHIHLKMRRAGANVFEWVRIREQRKTTRPIGAFLAARDVQSGRLDDPVCLSRYEVDGAWRRRPELRVKG